MKRYSKIIFDIREAMQLERVAFAKKLGVSYHTIYGWETGYKFPSRSNLEILIKYANRNGLKVNSTDFFDV